MTLNDIMSIYVFPPKGLLRTAYACKGIHYTYQKLIVHISIENRALHESEVEFSTCCTTAIIFVTTDLK